MEYQLEVDEGSNQGTVSALDDLRGGSGRLAAPTSGAWLSTQRCGNRACRSLDGSVRDQSCRSRPRSEVTEADTAASRSSRSWVASRTRTPAQRMSGTSMSQARYGDLGFDEGNRRPTSGRDGRTAHHPLGRQPISAVAAAGGETDPRAEICCT